MYNIGVLSQSGIWKSLSSYWRFNETSGSAGADVFGTRNTTIVGSPYNANGMKNGCFKFAGDSSTTNLTAANVFTNAQVVSGSVGMWIKVPIHATQNMLFFSIEGWVAIGAAVTTGYFIGQSDGGAFDTFGTTNICTNNWVHIVYTWNSTTGYLYMNGGYITSKAQASSPTPDSTSRTSGIGCNWNGHYYFNGYMDEVGFWSNRVLTEDDCKELYNQGAGIYY